ncbi:hypothetical protein [Stenotrophomonas sp. NRRL B-14846]|uniref:hypothetical protein n=1 Tax=Stenotrophomonas sp. NRRL B-14846 TaxID=3162882 RepID=UPI003D2E824E
MDKGSSPACCSTRLRRRWSSSTVPGAPLAANPAAREHGLPATVAAYAPMLEDLRLMAADGGIVACTLPGGPRGHYDGHLRAVHDGAGNCWRSP